MPQLAEPIPCPYDLVPDRIHWTRAQCDAMREIGVLNGRYELIDGEVISKMGLNPPHSLTVIALRLWLSIVFGGEFVRTEATIDIGDTDPDHNDPLPDVSVTVETYHAYAHRHPGPADLVLVAEVSDSTLRYDRTTKAALYALAGICEYWIIDVAGRRVLIHRQPAPDGYLAITAHGFDEMVATLAQPDESIQVSNLLPPKSQ
jgi:Uma2 family endonuclease